jgi:hypothetical protein
MTTAPVGREWLHARSTRGPGGPERVDAGCSGGPSASEIPFRGARAAHPSRSAPPGRIRECSSGRKRKVRDPCSRRRAARSVGRTGSRSEEHDRRGDPPPAGAQEHPGPDACCRSERCAPPRGRTSGGRRGEGLRDRRKGEGVGRVMASFGGREGVGRAGWRDRFPASLASVAVTRSYPQLSGRAARPVRDGAARTFTDRSARDGG